jgi:hypothetical protein
MSIGQDLLDVPFARMVENLAFAIADGQQALDRTSLDTARQLATTTVELIPEIHEVIYPNEIEVTRPSGNVRVPVLNPDGTRVVVTGASIDARAMDPETYTLLQAGLLPTFYQFTESSLK